MAGQTYQADGPGLIDTDLTAQLANGSLTIASAIDADDELPALRQALVGIRSAVHSTGAGAATWDGALVASVRPFEAADYSPQG